MNRTTSLTLYSVTGTLIVGLGLCVEADAWSRLRRHARALEVAYGIAAEGNREWQDLPPADLGAELHTDDDQDEPAPAAED